MSYSEMKEQICTNVKKINEIIDDVNSSDKEQSKFKNAFTRHINSDHNGMITDKQINDINSIPVFKEEVRTEVNGISSQLENNMYKLQYTTIDTSKPPTHLEPTLGNNTDETEKINSILRYANKVGIKNVYIPSGKYLIDSDSEKKDYPTIGGILIPSNINLIMEKDTELIAIPHKSEFYNVIRTSNSDNISIIGGKINGTKSNEITEFGHGVLVNGSKNVTIKDMDISNCNGDGICTTCKIVDGWTPSGIEDNKNLLFENNRIYNCGRQGISVVSGINVIIRGNEINDIKGTYPFSGIDIESNGIEKTYNIDIYQNNIYDCRGKCILIMSGHNINCYNNNLNANSGGIFFTWGASGKAYDNLIEFNTNSNDTVECFGVSILSNEHSECFNNVINDFIAGVNINQTGSAFVTNNVISCKDYGVNLLESYNTNITNNIINYGKWGVETYLAKIRNININNNVFNCNVESSINISTNGESDISIINNTIKMQKIPARNYIINVDRVNNSTISNNNIILNNDNVGDDLKAIQVFSNCNNVSVVNNHVKSLASIKNAIIVNDFSENVSCKVCSNNIDVINNQESVVLNLSLSPITLNNIIY